MDSSNDNTNPNIAKPTSIEVVIAGEVVTLTAVESEEYIQRLARYIDKKMVEIQKEKKIISFNSFLKTLIVALNVADDLYKEKDKADGLILENKKLKFEYEKALHEIKNLKIQKNILNEKISASQSELSTAKHELDEYINAFDKQEKFNGQVYKFKK